MIECIHDLPTATCSICNGRDQLQRTANERPEHVMESRFASRCGFCDEQIHVGDEIGLTDGAWIHVAHFGAPR